MYVRCNEIHASNFGEQDFSFLSLISIFVKKYIYIYIYFYDEKMQNIVPVFQYYLFFFSIKYYL